MQQQHKLSSSPVPSWHFARVPLFYCEVFSMPVSLQRLCCALTLHWGEIKMLSLGISLHWSLLSLLLVWKSSARGTAPPLCVGSGHTAQHEMGLCGAGGSGGNTGSCAEQKYRYGHRIGDKLFLFLDIVCVRCPGATVSAVCYPPLVCYLP